MKRTNIYLEETQSAALDQMAQAQGISRAELIRQLIDAELGGGTGSDLDADLTAIRDSFGVLRNDGVTFARGEDDRSRHLQRIAGR